VNSLERGHEGERRSFALACAAVSILLAVPLPASRDSSTCMSIVADYSAQAKLPRAGGLSEMIRVLYIRVK